jgi:hypothetical protein
MNIGGKVRNQQVASIIELMIAELYSIKTKLIKDLIYNNVYNKVRLYKKKQGAHTWHSSSTFSNFYVLDGLGQ